MSKQAMIVLMLWMLSCSVSLAVMLLFGWGGAIGEVAGAAVAIICSYFARVNL